ncbi:hypothetical protein MNBD_GAMMA08-1749 [hydrothermal vent metagenome]|uniref:Outer membrane protein beta-barrel domain-containing protein n=1 Tax=hydrothermal vent metagenome TaxID=652676 RepID=A0A3B0XZ72_9ZZZZ
MCITFSNFAQAENMLIDSNVFYTIPDAGGSDNFHTGKIVNVNFNYYTLPWLTITGGFFFSEEIADNTRSDIVGTFQASIETRGLALGVRPEYKFSERNKIYNKSGFLYYNTKVKVDEFFEAGLPIGSSSASTNGYGFFISFGWEHSLTQSVTFQLELGTQKQLDLFDGKTTPDRVFDLTTTGFSVGIGYRF